MNEELEMAIFGIISGAGEAKSIGLAAISLAKAGDIAGAREKLLEIKKARDIAQHHHTALVQKEAQLMLEKEKSESTETSTKQDFSISLLLIHAEDQMMSADVIEIMAKEMVDLYDKINNQ